VIGVAIVCSATHQTKSLLLKDSSKNKHLFICGISFMIVFFFAWLLLVYMLASVFQILSVNGRDLKDG